MDRLALQPLRLTKGQMIQYRIAHKKLKSEREDYMQAMDAIVEAISTVSKSNEQMKADIIEKIKRIQSIELEIEQTPEEIKAALERLRVATRRYTKYRQHVSERAKGIMFNRLSQKVARLAAELDEMTSESTQSKAVVEEDRDILKQLGQLMCLRHELISTNARLRDEARRLFGMIDFGSVVVGNDVFEPIKILRKDLAKTQMLKQKLVVPSRFIESVATYDRMDAQLDAASACVEEVERLCERASDKRPASAWNTRNIGEFCSALLRTDKIRMSIFSDLCGGGFVMPFAPLNLSRLRVDSASKSAHTSTTNLLEITEKLPQSARRPLYGTYFIHQDARTSEANSDEEKSKVPKEQHVESSVVREKFSSILSGDESLTDALFGVSEDRDKSIGSGRQEAVPRMSVSDTTDDQGHVLLDDVPDLDPRENIIIALFNLAVEKRKLEGTAELSEVEFAKLGQNEIDVEAASLDSQRQIVLPLREDGQAVSQRQSQYEDDKQPQFAKGTVRRKRSQSSASEVFIESGRPVGADTCKKVTFKQVRGTVRRKKRCLSELDDDLPAWKRRYREFKSDSDVFDSPERRRAPNSVTATCKRNLYTLSDFSEIEVNLSLGQGSEIKDAPTSPKRISLLVFDSDSIEPDSSEKPPAGFCANSTGTFGDSSFGEHESLTSLSSSDSSSLSNHKRRIFEGSRLGWSGDGTEGLQMYVPKSRYGANVIRRNVVARVMANMSPDPSQTHGEEETEGSRRKSLSGTSWAKELLKSAIDTQLSRTGTEVAITDLKVAIVRVNQEIQELAEEKEMMDNYLMMRRNPVLKLAPMVQREYVSADPAKPIRRSDGVNCTMTGTMVDDLTQEIWELNRLLSKTVILEQQKLIIDAHFPELQTLHQHMIDQNRQLQREIDELERHLEMICPEDVLVRRRRLRAQFEAARDEKLHILQEIETQLKAQEDEIASLEKKLSEHRYLNQTLQKKVADEQRNQKPNVKNLCTSRTELKGTDKGQKEQIKQGEIEIAYYDSEINIMNNLLSDESMGALQKDINRLQRILGGYKDSFHQRLRRATRNRKVPYTHIPEISSINARTREIDAQLVNLRRKRNMVNSRIQRLSQVLDTYRLRIPAPPA